ncbi:MAG: hypothetical protein GEU73_04085 [Chloroflexi bacterium]|nr:hypothetical protein [Chloroflexota bacterium]
MNASGEDGVSPFDALEVPLREGPRVGLYDEILMESGIMVADLRVAVIDELWYGMLRAASAVRKFWRLVAAFARPPVSVETSRPTAAPVRRPRRRGR